MPSGHVRVEEVARISFRDPSPPVISAKACDARKARETCRVIKMHSEPGQGLSGRVWSNFGD